MKIASMVGSFSDAYSTYTGMSSLESDFSAWVSTQTAVAGPTIPTQLPEDAEEMLRGIGEVDLMDEFLKDSGKDYLPKDVQSSFVHDMNVMVTAGKELVSVLASQTAFPGVFPQSTAEAEEKNSAAGRVGPVGAWGRFGCGDCGGCCALSRFHDFLYEGWSLDVFRRL